jgi:hypothetical protein
MILSFVIGLLGTCSIPTLSTDSLISYQTSRIANDSIVKTPFGPAFKSHVHYVDKDHYITINDNQILLIKSKTGNISWKSKFNQTENDALNRKSANVRNSTQQGIPSTNKEGWITYVNGQIFPIYPKPINFFSTNWTVPTEPLRKSDQLLYLFNSLMTYSSEVSHIMQPVLQWGISPAGGGKHWSICNWYVIGEDQFFYDSLIKVSPDTNLTGVIKLTSQSDSLFNYYSYFDGYQSGLQVNNLPRLHIPSIVLETYNVKGCEDFPVDEKIRFRDIKIMTTDNIKPQLTWSPQNEINKPPYYCSQFTKVLDESSTGGEIDIHFHVPTSIDNYNDIHIYPNPCDRFLHISPNSSLDNCRIEIYNKLGCLIQTNYYKKLDYELSLSLENYSPGLYILRFYYDYKVRSFEIVKN